MNVVITNPQASATCVWCDRKREAVQATFSDGFLTDVPICFKCLQQAIKVRSGQLKPNEGKNRSEVNDSKSSPFSADENDSTSSHPETVKERPTTAKSPGSRRREEGASQ